MNSQFNHYDKENKENGKIFLKKEAFRNMITHVLRFGDEALEESMAVVGICLGSMDKNGENIIVANAIPITHGNEIETEFSQEMRETIAKIEKEHEHSSVLGWYHSHPGKGLYFSDVDKKNQQYFQKKDSPFGFGIVFDHALMGKEGNFGFEVYRLNNYKKTDQYHRISYEIEIPNSLEYFKWVQKFIEDSQKKKSILINELNELERPLKEELQEIPSFDAKLSREALKEDFPHLDPVISGFEDGVSKFVEIFFNSFKPQLAAWTKNFDENINKSSEYELNIVNQMKKVIPSGLTKVRKWFEKNIDEILKPFNENVAKHVDKGVSNQNDLIGKINTEGDNLCKDLVDLADKAILNIVNDIQTRAILMKDNLNDVAQNNVKLYELINKIHSDIENIVTTTNNVSDTIMETTMTAAKSFHGNLLTELENFNSRLDRLKKSYSEIDIALQKLRTISDNF